MKFMLLMIPKGYEAAEPGTLPPPERIAPMMAFNQTMEEAGIVREAAGLHPPSMGARVTFSGGKPSVQEPPFSGVTETLGGYWVIEVASKEEAVSWAKRCPASANEIIEVRQMQAPEDFA